MVLQSLVSLCILMPLDLVCRHMGIDPVGLFKEMQHDPKCVQA